MKTKKPNNVPQRKVGHLLIEKWSFWQYSTEMRKGTTQNSSSEDYDSALSLPDKENY